MTTPDDEDREYPEHPLVGVGAIVLGDDKVLLVRRGREPSKGLWSIPGGLVELGEGVRDAVKREVMEETGLDVDLGELFDVVDAVHRDQAGKVQFHYVIVDFLAESKGSKDVKPVPGTDVDDARWIPIGGLARLDMTKSARTVIEKALRGRSP